jgi:hypothetical protein
MPHQTNLNTFPYFDDFDPKGDYYKVLFKPGYPIQARELLNVQSILQNQIESFGNWAFKEGSIVIPGGLHYNKNFYAVELKNEFNGINVYSYILQFLGKTIRGEKSGVRAYVTAAINEYLSERGNVTIYVNFLDSDASTFSYLGFADNENLIIEDPLEVQDLFDENNTYVFQTNQAFATTLDLNCNSVGSSVVLSDGVYFIRGHFIRVEESVLILDQYSNIPSYFVGFIVNENIITSSEDPNLTDNAQGFSNYAAPGADRLAINPVLVKLGMDEEVPDNFIQLMKIIDGVVIKSDQDPKLNELGKELARRTYDESGDYYVTAPTISVNESLNDYLGNNGIYNKTQITFGGNIPSDDLGVYQISPLKAYVRGYEVENISPVFVDFNKTRETKRVDNQEIVHNTGSSFTLNNVTGSPILGITTSYSISLRDSRVGSDIKTSPGKEIGIARVYDFALESTSSSTTLNEWDISLYDIQTYTDISINESVTLEVPCQIKGSSSGTVAYLKYPVTNSGIITAYSTSNGSFLNGEKIIFNGIDNEKTRTSIAVTSYGLNNIKSLYGSVGTAYTFASDIKQISINEIGTVSISSSVSGVSTVTTTNTIFEGFVSKGDIVSYTKTGSSIISFAKVDSVFQNKLTIVGIASVSNLCDGTLPISSLNINDFKILGNYFPISLDNKLFTELPKNNVQTVDLTNSNLIIRKQIDINITSNSSGIISADSDETFLQFDEERYAIIRSDGVLETLTEDKFDLDLYETTGGKQIRFYGLGTNSAAKLIATLRKVNIKTKNKNKNIIKSIIVSKSKYEGSGIGSTTLNDGLTYGNYPYGTRVHDEEICLLEAGISKIHAIFESSNIADPIIPKLTFSSILGENGNTDDLSIGEILIGETSNTLAIYTEKINSFTIGYISLNSNSFIIGEKIISQSSNIDCILNSITLGDNDISSNYSFDDGQRNSIHDYSRIIRKNGIKEPIRKLKIYFESSDYSSSDTGDITTVDSYSKFNYKEIPSIRNVRNSDIIDFRPRVSKFTVSEGSRSPFEFLSRDFSNSYNNSSTNILASDETFQVSYSYYLPRIDRIFLTKDGVLQIKNGEPSDNPNLPPALNDALEIASVYLPPYLYNVSDATITSIEHKRYQMSDIENLEKRIKNLEFYSTLSLLEKETSNLNILDNNGLSRFKSGFFVDNFSSTLYQKKETIVKNSIDVKNLELRPSHYTTGLDLVIGITSSIVNKNSLVDINFSNDLVGTGVTKTGKVITLNYEEVVENYQPFSTRVISIAPFKVNYYSGSIVMNPSSDVWVDTVKLPANNVKMEGDYTETTEQLQSAGFDPQTGFNPSLWDSSSTLWTATDEDGYKQEITIKQDYTNISLGNAVVASDVSPIMRSRNIEFIGQRFKPNTRFYAFFDNVDVNNFIIPKLIEITMTSGIFQVGETVVGSILNLETDPNSPKIICRVAKPNHKFGSYDNPVKTYLQNPYSRDEVIPDLYSSTSKLLNIDTFSLSYQGQSNFFGYIQKGMILKGQTSQAEATISDIRLVSDYSGTILGSFFIPNPNVQTNPVFKSGIKLFRLTNSSINSQVEGIVFSSGEERYYSQGSINLSQENVLSIRNARIETQTPTQTTPVGPVYPTTPVGDNSPPRSYTGDSSPKSVTSTINISSGPCILAVPQPTQTTNIKLFAGGTGFKGEGYRLTEAAQIAGISLNPNGNIKSTVNSLGKLTGIGRVGDRLSTKEANKIAAYVNNVGSGKVSINTSGGRGGSSSRNSGSGGGNRSSAGGSSSGGGGRSGGGGNSGGGGSRGGGGGGGGGGSRGGGGGGGGGGSRGGGGGGGRGGGRR